MNSSSSEGKVEAKRKSILAVELILLSALLSVFSFLRLYDLGGRFAYDYDEGVYLQTAKQFINGYNLYNPIFLSQPPLFLYMVAWALRILGENLYAGRLPVALTSILTGLAAYIISRKTSGPVAGLASLVTLTFNPVFLRYSRAVEGEVPCIAFTLLAFALLTKFVETDRWPYSFTSGFSASLAILSKFLAAPAVAAMIPVFLTGTGVLKLKEKQRASRGLRLKYLIPFIAGGILPLSTLLLFDFDPLYDQLYLYHLSKPPGGSPAEKLLQILRYLSEDPAVTVLGLVGVAVAVASLHVINVCIALSAVLSLAMLTALPQPVWYHHLATLTPQLSILSGLTLAYLLNLCRRFHRKASRTRRRAYTAAALALTLFTLIPSLLLYGFSVYLSAEKALPYVFSRGGSLEFRVAELIANLTSSSDWVISDSQAIVFVAGRNVPPELCDTSFMRISSGYLTDDEVIQVAEAYQVKIVVFWTDRLIQLKRFVEYVEGHFDEVASYGKGRIVYVRKH